MRYLILSDIHANWEALTAVLEDAGDGYDRILCLGDVVGYGADPNAVTEWVRDHVQTIVRGNHDKVATGSEDISWFNPIAQQGSRWTMQALTADNLAYIETIPKGPLDVDGFQLVHGSPLDEDEYLLSAYEAAQLWGYLETQVTFFGHTHVQGGFQLHRNGTRPLPQVAPRETRAELALADDLVYLINPGSVGQPRDSDPRAGYAVWTPEDRLVEYRRVEYDIRTAQRKILEAGLPELLAARLSIGS